MNATKRKFNALLQSLGARPEDNSPSADQNGDPDPISASMAADLEFLSKRRRITAHGPSAAKQNGTSVTTATTPPQLAKPFSSSPAGKTSVVLRKFSLGGTGITNSATAAAKADGPGAAEPPRYCPGDREQLIKRLATFQELTEWTPKPDRVSEVEWAKRGWVCRGRERVRCVLCEKELVVKLNRKEVDGREVSVLVPSEIEDALVEKYVELMVTSHQDDCLWKKRGCDDSLLHIAVFNPNAVLSDLRQRYDELLAREASLPYEVNLRLPTGLDLDKVASSLPQDFFTNPPPKQPAPTSNQISESLAPPPPNRVALALALLGWQGLTTPRTGAVPNSASCHTCLRRLGLWMFKSKELDPATGAVRVPAIMDHLDPLREHRFFCPWKNGAAQRPSSGGKRREKAGGAQGEEEAKPAWALVVEMLRNEAHLRGVAAEHARTGSSAARGTGAAVATPMGTPSRPRPGTGPGAADESPSRSVEAPTVNVIGPADGEQDEAIDDAASLEAKDKERWARLRKVKSFFSVKDGKKLKRLSRPGTSHSTAGAAFLGGSS